MKVFKTTLLTTSLVAVCARRVDLHESKSVANHTQDYEWFSNNDFQWHGTGSPFEEWVAAQDTPDCPARVLRSRCSDADFRGLVVYFHGFSACSQQVDGVSDMLVNNCLDVLAPTLPGHGHAAVWCGEGGNAACDSVCGNGMGWTHNTLPTHQKTYVKFAREAHAAIKRELNYRSLKTRRPTSHLEVSISGLSFGAALAFQVARMGEGFYARQLLINPYLALGDESIDQSKMNCEALIDSGRKTAAECEHEAVVAWLTPAGLDSESYAAKFLGLDSDNSADVVQNLFTTLAKVSDAVGNSYQGHQEGSLESSVAGLMEGDTEWSSVCMDIWAHGRGGFCKFKVKHLLATHSFALHALVDAHQHSAWSSEHLTRSGRALGFPVTQIITSERDGSTRNGMSYDLARHLFSVSPGKVSMCMHKFRDGVDRSNTEQYFSDENSMPHASFKGTRAPGRWWEPKLFENMRSFMTGERASISEPQQFGRHHDRNVCEVVPLGPHSDVSDLVDVGISPTKPSQLALGFTFNALWLAR